MKCEKFFHLYNSEHYTRGHYLKLATTRCRLELLRNFSVSESSHTGTSYQPIWSRQKKKKKKKKNLFSKLAYKISNKKNHVMDGYQKGHMAIQAGGLKNR